MDNKTYISNLIKDGIPYKFDPPYSFELGHDCYSWVSLLYNKFNGVYKIPETLPDIKKPPLKDFEKVYNDPKYLDMPIFLLDTISRSHIGLMLDDKYFTHCSEPTNGASIGNITKQPWKSYLKYFYRHK